jgi:hypothetical protein
MPSPCVKLQPTTRSVSSRNPSVQLTIQPAMRILIDALKVSHLPWPETLVLQSKEKIDVDPQDGMSHFIRHDRC